MRSRPTAAACLLALMTISLVLGGLLAGPRPPSAQAMAAMQFTIIPPITLVFNTPTRTPTPINVGNFVWDDLDHDGRQDAGEPGLPGVNVQLWNAAKTQLIDTAVTNSAGIYTLVAPTPGDYRVRVLLPSPLLDQFSPKDIGSGDNPDLNDSDINPTGLNAGFTDIYTFNSNLISITTIDAGLNVYRTPTPTRTPTPINVGNFVWHDLNFNGVQNAGEPGVHSLVMQLWNSTKTQLIDTAVTNSNGNYTLQAPAPGDYRVRIVIPGGSGMSLTWKNLGDDLDDNDFNPGGVDAGFTDVYTFGSNLISITSIDAGLVGVPAVWPSATASITPTPTLTRTPTPTPTVTVNPSLTFRVFLPLVRR